MVERRPKNGNGNGGNGEGNGGGNGNGETGKRRSLGEIFLRRAKAAGTGDKGAYNKADSELRAGDEYKHGKPKGSKKQGKNKDEK